MLEYGMGKEQVLQEVYPEEVGFLLDEAEKRKAEFLLNLLQVFKGDPKEAERSLKNRLNRLEAGPDAETRFDNFQSMKALASLSGDAEAVRRFELNQKALNLMGAHGKQ